jgi:hypothetical protein
MTIRVKICSYGEFTGERFFSDFENVAALEYAENAETGEQGETIEIWRLDGSNGKSLLWSSDWRGDNEHV